MTPYKVKPRAQPNGLTEYVVIDQRIGAVVYVAEFMALALMWAQTRRDAA